VWPVEWRRAFPVTFSDLQGHSPTVYAIVRPVLQQLTEFQSTLSVARSSTTTEYLAGHSSSSRTADVHATIHRLSRLFIVTGHFVVQVKQSVGCVCVRPGNNFKTK